MRKQIQLANSEKYEFSKIYRRKTRQNTITIFWYFIDFDLLFTMVSVLELCYLSHMAKFGLQVCGKSNRGYFRMVLWEPTTIIQFN